MNIKIKICGMREPDNIGMVGELKPDYMGFIFYKGSPRCVPEGFIIPAISSTVKRVGVFVNEQSTKINEGVRRYSLDLVQLHGDESVEACEELKQNDISIIKAFSVNENFDFKKVRAYKKVVDFFLFDTKGNHYGGNATSFNWNLLEKYDQEVPFFLSGGISVKNLDDVTKLHGMNLHSLDVNSGVEVSPGLKSVELVNSIIKKIKEI